jgi:DNA polymerase III subunit gamma/tau
MLSKEFRPFHFSEVAGQKGNITAFKNYSKTIGGTFPDVMLFQGSSGTGKTTCAYIIAATVNCEQPILNKDGYYEPCGECASCKSIKNKDWSKDVHFFNASEMKPDDVLSLERYASMSPWNGGKKTIIIIDEFQELSNKSKGSSLVLFEKERKDAMFILCTMDDKIEKAVQSRAQNFLFKPLSASAIEEDVLFPALDELYKEKDIPFDTKALMLIGENSWGSARQALQYLERCIASELFTVDTIQKELKFISEEKTFNVMNDLINGNIDYFSKIDDVDIYGFYMYAWKIISTTQRTILTESSDSWKYKSSINLYKNPNYNKLVEAFLNIEKSGYFKEYIYNFYIENFFITCSKPVSIKELSSTDITEKKTRIKK